MDKIELPDMWGPGQLLAFSGIDGNTDFENGLCLKTSSDVIGLDVVLPACVKIVFSSEIPEKTLLSGDIVELVTRNGNIRGAFLDAYHFLLDGHCSAIKNAVKQEDKLVFDGRSIIAAEKSKEIVVKQEGNRTLIGVEGFFNPLNINADLNSAIYDRLKWLRSMKIPSGLPVAKRKVFSKAVSIMKTQVYTPSGWIKHRWTTPDRWPHRRMWLWDSAFHAIGWRHIDLNMAKECIDSVFDSQCEDGRIACTCGPDTISKEVTQPPVLAMAIMAVDAIDPDIEWLKGLYPKICRYVQWDLDNRDSDGNGLLEWFTSDSPICRSGESGMDNCSRFDAGVALDATDFNSYIALECEILSEIAQRINKTEDADYWSNLHRRICRLINERLWDEKLGLYVDCIAKTGEKTGILAGAGFLPLICSAPSQVQAQRMAQHMDNPSTFGTRLPVATISPSQSAIYSKDMWRGPVWVNLNWMISKGFSRYGLDTVAESIRDKTMLQIEHYYEKYGSLFEFYDESLEVDPPKLLRKGKNDPASSPYHQVFYDYGWTANLYVDWLMSKNKVMA